jgi:Tfp pilus assembly protein PilW
MKCNSCHPTHEGKSAAGFTLTEMLISVGVSMLLLLGAAVLFINGNECFVAMANYQNLDAKSCRAMDILSREIRGASGVAAFSSTSFTLTNSLTAGAFSVSYDANSGNVVLSDVTGTTVQNDIGQSPVTLLTGCKWWNAAMFTGLPYMTNAANSYAFNFNGTPTPTPCKVIQMSWRCVRTYLGRAITTESVQTAQIVMRNKTY